MVRKVTITMKHIRNHDGLRGILFRAGLMLAILALLGGVLVSCGGGTTTPTLTLNKDSIVTVEGENGLTRDRLTNLGRDIQESKNALAIREGLAAALNGYDMTMEGFDDNNLPVANPDKAVDYALNVLKKYEISNGEEGMTRADVQTLVNAFKTTVATEESIGVLTRILTWVAIGFEWMIKVLGFGSFILGTLIFAIVVEILLLPLAIYQQKNARKQARLRPKEMAIRKKYAGRTDQKTVQEMNGEIQKMYQDEGFNQLSSGCLPMIITLVIAMALYYIVIDPLKYMMSCPSEVTNALITFATTSKAAGGMGLQLQSSRGTIEILSHLRELGGLCPESLKEFQYFTNSQACYETLSDVLASHTIPNFSLGSVNFGLTPSISTFNFLLAIPVLTFGVYFGSMKLTRKFTYQPTTANDPGMGCSNTIMDVSMPILSSVFTFMVPGAVGLYWLFKSLIGTLKQFIMSKVMPLPQFTDADYKAAEKELAAKEKGRPVKKSSGSGTRNPNVRSLHHIDDEDFETPAPTDDKKKATPKAADTDDTTATTDKAETTPADEKVARGIMADGAVLKDDREDDRKARKEKNDTKGASEED